MICALSDLGSAHVRRHVSGKASSEQPQFGNDSALWARG